MSQEGPKGPHQEDVPPETPGQAEAPLEQAEVSAETTPAAHPETKISEEAGAGAEHPAEKLSEPADTPAPAAEQTPTTPVQTEGVEVIAGGKGGSRKTGPRPAPSAAPISPAAMDLETARKATRDTWSSAKEFLKEAAFTALERSRHTSLGDAAAGLERLRMRFIDKSATAYNEHFYQKANRQSAGIAAQVTAHERIISEEKRALAGLEETLGRIGGSLSPAEAMRYEKERDGYRRRIEKGEAARDLVQIKLERINDVKSKWENRQKSYTEEVVSRVEDRSRPFTERLEALRPERDQLSSEIDAFRERRGAFAELAAKLGSGPQARALRAQIKEMDRNITARHRKLEEIDGRMSSAHERLGKWTAVKNEFTRVANRPREYKTGKPLESMAPNYSRRGLSLDREVPFDPARQAQATPSAPAAAEGPGERSLENKAITLDQYVDLWNKHFKSELNISAETLAKETKLERNSKNRVPSLEMSLRMHARRLIEASADNRRRISQKKLEKNLEQLRHYLRYDASK